MLKRILLADDHAIVRTGVSVLIKTEYFDVQIDECPDGDCAWKVLILTMSSEDIYARTYMQLGVMGFINKEANTVELRKAITTVMNNRKYLSPALQETINHEATDGAASGNPFGTLSARELEVMTPLKVPGMKNRAPKPCRRLKIKCWNVCNHHVDSSFRDINTEVVIAA